MLVMGGLVSLLIAGLFLDLGNAASDREADEGEADGPEDLPDCDIAVIFPDPGNDANGPEDGLDDQAYANSDHQVGASSSGVSGQWGLAGAGDILMGGTDHDVIRGGHGGNDLRGGLGDDTIHGGDGDDWIQGEGTYGPGGNDVIHGGGGADSLCGQGGNDLIDGGDGDDTILGGEGDDSLFGMAGNDWLSGGEGDDLLISTSGSDDLDGGRGNDVLIGHDSPETVWMNGGEGDDTLMPGAHDFASGNAGADTFILRSIP
ncbi:MAG: calcium-binding protein, partial [Paracoccus sp. (in: a-proteobacteria)]|nr:calcium-binding protein [Paracoccus sp. (in: a-proteobacteria)]